MALWASTRFSMSPRSAKPISTLQAGESFHELDGASYVRQVGERRLHGGRVGAQGLVCDHHLELSGAVKER